ncbi:MAG: 6,7-dimethyl-8-ribityllumazine synthase [Aquificaceae bacterium]|nr:6,7-dimethyl-8-ribityllumazine synthase [Aquificaceae bacterium]MCX8164637.1 6,7-dimethyl-8-ribityllumazine synthase [Aquificaceae bacterium]
MQKFEGILKADGISFGIVASRFNHMLVDRLIEGAVDCILRHGGSEENTHLVRVPGSWELPVAVKGLINKKKVEGIVALGVLIRGQTPHFEYIANEVTKGLAMIGLETGIPIGFGVVTADTLEQAIERAGTKQGNKGWEAALSVIEMVNLLRSL